jgi:hypothetical protein
LAVEEISQPLRLVEKYWAECEKIELLGLCRLLEICYLISVQW